MPPTFSVVHNEPNLEAIAALERLLALAKTGSLVGLAYVAIQAGNGYSGDVLGDLSSHRLLALGMCRELEALFTK